MSARLDSVLIIHTFGLGDWIMFSPCLRALVEQNPTIKIHVLLSTAYQKEFIEMYPNVEVISTFTKKPVPFLLALIKSRTTRYDACIFPSGFHSYHADYAAPFIRAKRSLCLRDQGHRPRFLTDAPEIDRTRHRVLNNVSLMESLGVPVPQTSLYFPKSVKGHDSDSKRLLIHPGSSERLKFKRWPIERFVEVSQVLSREGWQVSWIFGPEDAELKSEVLAQKADAQFHETLSPTELATMIAKQAVVLTSDSAISHIGAALEKPTVTIFGPANRVYTQPWGVNARVLQAEQVLDCRPCIEPGGRYGCEERPCLVNLSVEAVVTAVQSSLKLGTDHDLT